MLFKTIDHTARLVNQAAQSLTGATTDYDALLDNIGEARFVLIGEASHGTHEFYRERAKITQRLIAEKGFHGVAVEADWPDAYRVNRYVRNQSDDEDAQSALGDFQRFPTWMWRNADVLHFIEWLRQYNQTLPKDARRVGFYGLDLYSLYNSIGAVLDYLDKVDPEAARQARYRYSCFDHMAEDSQTYGYAASVGIRPDCRDEVIEQLLELQRHAVDYAQRDGRIPEDEFFFAEQNARLVRNAEEYYRTMFGGRISSWNLRDRHMAETLDHLANYLSQAVGQPAKLVLWAHNSHLGDARATDMGRMGELNVGQLARERYAQAAFSVGFSTYTGTVTAASNWDEPAQRKNVRPALSESYESLFHDTDLKAFYLNLRPSEPAVEALQPSRLERAIGVIYRPQTERVSHYFDACLPKQFDALLHFDQTQAVEPLERTAEWELGEAKEAPETYPYGV
jgi:erythromycin esterase-like protein